MTATPSQLAARVLRRLGVAVVAVADRAAEPSDALTAAEVADRALRMLGVAVPDGAAQGATAALQDIAQRALRLNGANPLGPETPQTAPLDAGTIALRALQHLGVVAADEVPQTNDLSLAVEAVVNVHEEMRGLGAADWTANTIPARAAEHYVALVANKLAPTFARPADQQNYTLAREQIRLLALSGPAAQQRAEAAVRSTHDGLLAAGLAWSTLDQIPGALAEDYAAIAGHALAPVYGRPQDHAAREAAEARIKRAAVVRGARQQAEAEVRRAHAEITAGGLADWTSDTIPAAAADAYAQFAALSLSPMFGGAAADPARRADLEMRLRRYVAGSAAGQAIAERKVWEVHADLEARGMTRWSLDDLPLYAEGPYVMLAAFNLAPEFGFEQNPADLLLAEKALAKVISVPTSGAPVAACYF